MIRPQPKPVRAPKRNRQPLKRLRWMVKKAPRRVTRPGPGSDPEYLAEVRKRRCLVGGCVDGELPSHAHHAGPKSNDSTAVPMCARHHQEWHDANGFFKRATKEARRDWAATAITVTRAARGWVARATGAGT